MNQFRLKWDGTCLPAYTGLIVFISFFSFSFLSAQPIAHHIKFEHFGENEGLKSSNLSVLHQDPQGYLWVGGLNGLFRYDGRNFQPVKFEDSDIQGISKDYIKVLADGPGGEILAASESGQLYEVAPNTLHVKAIKIKTEEATALDKLAVYGIQKDDQNRIWVSIKNLGILLLNPSSGIVSFPEGMEETFSSLIKMRKAADGTLWANQSKGLIKITPTETKFEIKSYPYPFPFECIDFGVGRNGTIWLGGRTEAIVQFNSNTETYTKIPFPASQNPLVKSRVNSVVEDKNGFVWAGTNDDGLVIYSPGTGKILRKQKAIEDPYSLSNNTITDLLVDATGIIWMTTWGNGLNKHAPATAAFQHFRHILSDQNTLLDPEVITFYEEDAKTLWISTLEGLNRLDKASGKIFRYPMPDFIAGGNNRIHYISHAPISSDELWLGTNTGIVIFNKKTASYKSYFSKTGKAKLLENGIVYFIPSDKDNNVWAVGYSPYQIFKYNIVIGDFEPTNIVAKNAPSRKTVVIADRQHNIWIGTPGNQFFRYDLNSEILHTYQLDTKDSSGFFTERVGHCYQDHEGNSWLGTESGLFKINENKSGPNVSLQYWGLKQGLPDDHLKGVTEDEFGRLWLSSSAGLTILSLDGTVLRHLNKNDGLQANEFGYETFAKSKFDNLLYFGGNNGFNIIDPSKIPIDTCAPKVQISEILLLDENKMVSQMEKVDKEGKLTIGPFQKVLTIRFAGLDFESPLRNQFACKLEGFDSDWRQLGHKDEITYTNLDPGNYVLQVKAANKDGLWSHTPVMLAITAFPPWWETWWAMIFYMILISSAVIFIYKNQLRQQRAEAESQKIREMDKMKSRLYTNITHEFRTPLTVITAMSDLIEKPAKSKELIKRNADSLLQLVNQLLDLSKVESGNLKLKMIQADIVPFVQYITESFNSYAANKQINLVSYMESDELIMDFDEYKLHSILSNLLSNAVKFTPEGGKIILHLHEKGDEVIIKVKDTGIGIPEDKLDLIFDQFYQVDDSSTRKGEGTGIGLTLTKELVELMEGTIEVKSQAGGGTEFKVSLPITRNAPLGEITKVQISPNLPPPDRSEQEDFYSDAKLPLLLLIEDNTDVATYLQIWLKGKYEVLHAKNGALGIKMAKEVIPDVIITDVMMPEKDGFEVCRTLKSDETTSHVPIIVLTAKTDDASRIEGLERGADAYLSKPFIKKELLVRLQSLIELRKKLQSRYSQVDALASPQPANLEDQFLQKVHEAINANLSDTDFSNANLASLLHLSESQLFRKLKALTGKSTAIYIRSYRLAKGKELLETTTLTVSEIAYEVGFSDPAYFSRTFSSEFGQSPNAIRK